MWAWPVRTVFACILAGSLAAKDRTSDVLADRRSLEPAVIRVAYSGGLAFRQATTVTGTDIRTLAFDAAGCSQPVMVTLVSVTFDQEPAVRSGGQPGYVLRYVYIDRSWAEPDRLAVFVERIKYAALALFGLTQFVPDWHLLLIQSPAHCRAADDVDWRFVWRRAPPDPVNPPATSLRTRPTPQQLGAEQHTADCERGRKTEADQRSWSAASRRGRDSGGRGGERGDNAGT
jgi:hypothetical protein